jgi:hypothetical protein
MGTVSSPGGQVAEMAGHEHCCGQAGVGRVWHLLDLPEGYVCTRVAGPWRRSLWGASVTACAD